MSWMAILWIALLTGTSVLGDYFVKLAADAGKLNPQFFIGMSIFSVNTIGWYAVMRAMTLTQVAVYFAVFNVLMLVAVAVICFGERLTPTTVVGIALGMVSIVLLSR